LRGHADRGVDHALRVTFHQIAEFDPFVPRLHILPLPVTCNGRNRFTRSRPQPPHPAFGIEIVRVRQRQNAPLNPFDDPRLAGIERTADEPRFGVTAIEQRAERLFGGSTLKRCENDRGNKNAQSQSHDGGISPCAIPLTARVV
jgi:hypothetical protein